MKNEKFMDQKMKDMSIKELAKAIQIKTEQEEEPEKELSVDEEMKKYPKRFERLNKDCCWETLGGTNSHTVLNSIWNFIRFDGNVFYVENAGSGGRYKEILRRKGMKWS